MDQRQKNTSFPPDPNSVSVIPLGGIEDVTKNMYLYIYRNEILIVDCGIGFADETMLGVDLLLPDISYLLKTDKKIVGMVLTHGHEDHIGATPFILPQLPNFPVYASPFTAALTNEKLKEFRVQRNVQAVEFDGKELSIGSFKVSFIRVTHSVPDTANIFIKTPMGNFFHGSDYKYDLTPADGKETDFLKIAKSAEDGVIALLSDCLGAERAGFTPSEEHIERNFEREMRNCTGKFVVTTYSSHISRLNQIIRAAERVGKKVCFVGRSLIKVKTIGQKIGYLQMKEGTEVQVDALQKIPDNKLVLIVAGSQGQENSAMTRIATGEFKEIKLMPQDLVVFSADPIPGHEVLVNAVVDSIAKKGSRVIYSALTHEFHVSGHGSQGDILLLMSLTKPKYLMPISGNYKHMSAYRALGEKLGYQRQDIILGENGQEIIFTKDQVRFGQKFPIHNVYVDQLSGEEVEQFVLRDRERLAKEGIIIIMAEVNSGDGQLAETPIIVSRGFLQTDTENLSAALAREIKNVLSTNKGKVSNWVHVRRLISDAATKYMMRKLRRQPLILPVVIEV